MKRWVYALMLFVSTGVFLGIFLIRRELILSSERAAVFPKEPVTVVGQSQLPEDAPEPPSTDDSNLPVFTNSEPLEIGPIIAGVQRYVSPSATMTPDQSRLETNVLRDFGSLLDPELHDPDSPGNQQAKDEMVKMLLSRSTDQPGQ